MSMVARRRPLAEWPRLEDRFDRVFRELLWDFVERETAADVLHKGWPKLCLEVLMRHGANDRGVTKVAIEKG